MSEHVANPREAGRESANGGRMSTVDVAAWDVDPDQWPHTPPLDVWRALYEDDDNLVWRAGIGHVVNALDEALERIEAVEAILAAWEAWDGSPGPDGGTHPDSSSPRDRDRLRAALDGAQ